MNLINAEYSSRRQTNEFNLRRQSEEIFNIDLDPTNVSWLRLISKVELNIKLSYLTWKLAADDQHTFV